MHFVEQAAREHLRMREIKLFGDRDGLYKGVEYFADLPYFLGTRGHAQMVPFGMGAIPVSLLVHHKTGYFARDLGHPEWAVDPRQDGFADRLYDVLRDVEERRTELRTELAEVRERFYRTTLDNLATIYSSAHRRDRGPGAHALHPVRTAAGRAGVRGVPGPRSARTSGSATSTPSWTAPATPRRCPRSPSGCWPGPRVRRTRGT